MKSLPSCVPAIQWVPILRISCLYILDLSSYLSWMNARLNPKTEILSHLLNTRNIFSAIYLRLWKFYSFFINFCEWLFMIDRWLWLLLKTNMNMTFMGDMIWYKSYKRISWRNLVSITVQFYFLFFFSLHTWTFQKFGVYPILKHTALHSLL